MARVVALAIVATATGLLCGCGTMANLACLKNDGDHCIRVYGGVALDAEALSRTDATRAPTAQTPDPDAATMKLAKRIYCLVDLPASALGDTLTLPLTVPTVLIRRATEEGSAGSPPADAHSRP